MFIFQLIFGNSALICTGLLPGGTRLGLAGQVSGQTEQRKSLSKDSTEVTAAQQGHGFCSVLLGFQIKGIIEVKNIILKLPCSLLSPQMSTLGNLCPINPPPCPVLFSNNHPLQEYLT